jgi:carbon starvation protein CstA
MPRRKVIGPGAGSIAGIGVLLICIIVLSVLARIVVKALVVSPWGTFTVFCTIPIALLMESFVAVMAMIAATVINPGVYFAMNSAGGVIGGDVVHAAQVISGWGFVVTPDMLNQVARDVGETTILSRTGGAPTLAVGMAGILSGLVGGKALMGLWYHSCQ